MKPFLLALLMLLPQEALAHKPSEAKRVCHRHSVQRLIRCFAGRIRPPGGAAKALDVAECESGFNRLAVSGPHVGLYQHVRSAWPERARIYMVGVPGSRDWRSARAQVVVSMKMAKAQGSWAVSWSCG